MVTYLSRMLPRYLLALALFLSGCTLSLTTTVAPNHDGSGTLTVLLEADENLQAQVDAAGQDPLTTLITTVEELPDRWRVRETETPNGRAVELSTTWDNPDEFNSTYASLQSALDTPEATLLGPLTLVQDDDGLFFLDGSTSLQVGQTSAADLGTTTDVLTNQLTGVVTSTLIVDTPGNVKTTTAPIITDDENNTLQSPTDTPARMVWITQMGQSLPVQTTFTQGGMPWLRYAVVGGVAVLGLGLIVVGLRTINARRARQYRRH